MKKTRILPAGFAVIILTLIVSLYLLATVIRLSRPADQLLYALKASTFSDMTGQFTLQTLGDAVNYTTKDFALDLSLQRKQNTLVIRMDDHQYILNSGDYQSQDETYGYQTFQHIILRDDFFKQLMRELLQEQEHKNILAIYEQDLYRGLRGFIKRKDDVIFLTMNLNEVNNYVLQQIDTLLSDPEVSRFASHFIRRDLIDSYSVQSLVKEWYIDSLSKLTDTFEKQSQIRFAFTMDKHQIQSIQITLDLKYKDCDAKEHLVMILENKK